jgi:hypothetical protein
MLMLKNSSTDKLQLVTDAASAIDVVVHWGDYTASTVVLDSTPTAISSATTTDICATPAASTVRKIKHVTIRNKGAGVNNVTVVFDRGGTDYEMFKADLNPGDCLQYNELAGFFISRAGDLDLLYRVLDADAAGSNVNTAQPWFPSAGGVTVQAATLYTFDGVLNITRAAGTTSHTTGMGFGGTATITSFNARYACGEGDVATLADDDCISATSAANINVKAASTSATEIIKAAVSGAVLINAAGTFIPQFTYSAAPGGAPTIEAGSWFELRKRATSKGAWA